MKKLSIYDLMDRLEEIEKRKNNKRIFLYVLLVCLVISLVTGLHIFILLFVIYLIILVIGFNGRGKKK